MKPDETALTLIGAGPIRTEEYSTVPTPCADDQTRHRLIEAQALAERRATARVEHLREVVFETDAEGRIAFLNQAWERLTGYAATESLGQAITRFVCEEDRDRCLALLGGDAAGKDCELRFAHRTGRVVWVGLSAQSLGSGAIVGSLYDVSARKRSEAAVHRDAEEAREQSESLLREAQRLARVGSWECDLLTGAVAWSDELYRIHGLEPGQAPVTNQLFWEQVHPEDRERVRRIGEQAAADHSPFAYHYRIVRPDGSLRVLHVRGQVLLDEFGRASRLVGADQDVTELKEAGEALLRSEAKYRSLIENIPDVVWTEDFEARTTFVSPSATRVFGYTPEEICGDGVHFWLRRIHPEDVARVQAAWDGLISRGELFDIEYRIRRKDGAWIWLHDRALGTYEKDGMGYVDGIFTDVTRRKEAEEALRIKTEELQAIAEAMMVFLGGGSLQQASAGLLRAALGHTQSEYGFIGVVVDGPVLRIVAHEGIRWDEVVNRDFYEKAVRSYREVGYLEFTSFDNLFGRVITTGKAVQANQPSTDPRAGGRPPGHPTLDSFLGVPILRGAEVVGMIGVANRLGGYTGAEQAQLEILTRATGVIYDSYRHSQRETALEQQLRQSQKMEAVGRLAGGVAHDFNNMLGVITGYSDLLLKDMRREDPRLARVEQIRKAAERAASLTRQLLAFSRKQVLQPAVLDLNSVVSDMETMLRRMIGEDIELVTVLGAGLERVKADPGQIEQVLMNLVVNARDAMPDGGKLVIETSNVDLDAAYARTHAGARPGPHVLLAVSDTGFGMDADTLAHVFEPFFTTKEAGKGTGLGLATVYGIVKQSGGYISVYSKPSLGATFKIYLPRVEDEAEPAPGGETRGEPTPAGAATILLVEDEEALRAIVREILESSGYAVLEAPSPEEGLSAARSHPGPVHLLLTDVIMPRMSGREMAECLHAIRPETRVLYISGYTSEIIGHHGLLEPGTHFLQKPFAADTLLRTVRAVLDRPGEASRDGVGMQPQAS